jgi:hypothetical protein
MSREKRIFCKVINESIGNNLLDPDDNGNVVFANVNASKDVWWADIKVEKFKRDLYFILNDTKNSLFHYLVLEANTIMDPEKRFRNLREGTISLELSSNFNNRFIDVKSGGTGFDFSPFKKSSVSYSEE